MRILFWGTPAYAIPSLEALVDAGHELVGVVSQPDRRRGRGSQLAASPVKQRAEALGLPVFTPGRIRQEPGTQAELAALGADLSVVVAFGQILPPEVLAQPPLGCWNGHGSLLPRWRGAAPIQWSLLAGDRETGVGIMAMEAGLDTGPVLLERRITIGLLDNAEVLAGRLAALTADLLLEALPRIVEAGPGPESERWRRLGVQAQSENGMTYARQLGKEDAVVDWSGSALDIHRRVMALYPGAHTLWKGRRLKLLATEPLVERLQGELSAQAAALCGRWGAGEGSGGGGGGRTDAGEVLAVAPGEGLVIATGGCPLLLRDAQLEGKRPCRGQALIQQLNARPGERMGLAAGS